jgi:hypothetical protein
MQLFLLAFLAMTGAQAQITSDHVLGLRLGASEGFAAEISYQYAISEKNRIEMNFGWRSADIYDGFRIVGLYQWVWKIGSGFNWYTGAGTGISGYRYLEGGSDTLPFLSGLAGIEFQLSIPVVLSADLRPQINLNSSVNTVELDFGIGVRYQF